MGKIATFIYAQRKPLLEQIKAWANYQSVKPRITHRPLTIAELSEIERGGIIELGGHTVSHPLLSEQSVVVQREEIKQSKLDLERLLNHPVTSFAYPFGAYCDETPALSRRGRISICLFDDGNDCLEQKRTLFTTSIWSSKLEQSRI